MERSSKHVSLIISSPQPRTEIPEKIVGMLSSLVKRPPRDIRMTLQTGKLRLAKVVVNFDLERLIEILRKNGLSVETTPLEADLKAEETPATTEQAVRSSFGLSSPASGSRIDWKKGDVIEGLYEVFGFSSGGMGKVYFVFHRLWKMMLAIKTPHYAAVRSETQVLRFLREAELWVDLGVHPNIATCYYARVMNGLPRLFIEYVDGGTLEHWKERHLLKDVRTVIDLMLQFCHGMIYAEQKGMIHRDIKPANCLISSDRTLKITDFGLVKRVEDPTLRTAGEELATDQSKVSDTSLTMFEHGILGSPWYMAPERFRHKGREDIRSDVYSFGIMLYQIALGAMPFEFPKGFSISALVKSHLHAQPVDPFSVKADFPRSLATIIMTCLEKKPENRYPSFVDVCLALESTVREILPGREPRGRPNVVGLKADSLNNQAVSLLDLGREPDARRLLEDAHSANPEHLEAVYNLHALKWSRGEISDLEVIRRLESLRIEVRETDDYRHLMGLVALQRGDSLRAVALLTKACQGSSQYRERWNAYGSDPKVFVDSLKLTAIREEASFAGHIKGVRALAFEPGSAKAFSIGEDRSIRVWDTKSGRCLKNLRTFAFVPVAGAFSRDGKLAATCYGNAFKTLDLWDLEGGRLLRRYSGMGGFGVCFSFDAKYFAAFDADRLVRVFEVSSDRTAWEFLIDSGRVTAAAFLGDGESVAVGLDDGNLLLWNLPSRKEIWRCQGHRGPISTVTAASDGSTIITGGWDETVRIFDSGTGQETGRFAGHRAKVVSAALPAGGEYVVSAAEDGEIKVWDRGSKRCCRTLSQADEELSGLAVSSDGRKILSGGVHGSIRLWAITTGWFSRNFLEPALCRPKTFEELVVLHASFTAAIEDFKRDWRKGDHRQSLGIFERIRGVPGFGWSREAILARNALAASSRPGGLISQNFIRSFYGHSNEIVSLTVSPDGLVLLTGSLDGTAGTWDVVTGRRLKQFSVGSEVRRIMFLPRVQGILTWSMDAVLRRWDLNGNLIGEIPEVTLPVSMGNYGSEIVAMSPDNRVVTINLETWQSSPASEAIAGRDFVCFSDSRQMLYGIKDGTRIQRWSVVTGRVEGAFRDLGLRITSLLPSEKDDKVIAGTETGEILIYMVGSGINLADLRGHKAAVHALASAQGGNLCVTGSDDCSLRLWDVEAQRCLSIMEGHPAPIRSVCIFPNLSLIASGSSDGSVRLWGLEWRFSVQ